MISEKWLKEHGFVKGNLGWELLIEKHRGYSYFILCQPERNRMMMQFSPYGHPAVPHTIDIYDCSTAARLVKTAKFMGYEIKKVQY